MQEIITLSCKDPETDAQLSVEVVTTICGCIAIHSCDALSADPEAAAWHTLTYIPTGVSVLPHDANDEPRYLPPDLDPGIVIALAWELDALLRDYPAVPADTPTRCVELYELALSTLGEPS